MTFPPLRSAALPLAIIMLAGCGTQSKPQSSAPTAGPVSTQPRSVPTAVVSGGSVAATVNGHGVPMSLYRLILTLDQRQYAGQPGATTKAIGRQALNQAIADEVVRQYAVAHNISVPSTTVNSEIQSETTRAGGTAKFQAALARAGLTLDQYRTLLAPNMLTRKVAGIISPVSNVKVAAAHVWHILISLHPKGKKARTDLQARVLAKNLLQQVNQGGDFAGLARQYSDDPGSGQQGGDLGNVQRGQTVPPFDKAVFSAPLHQPVLVHSNFGYHVVEVLSRGQVSRPSQQQQQIQQQTFSAWIAAQIKKAHIKRIAQVQ